MRLFVALLLNSDMISALCEAQAEILRLAPASRITDRNNLHLTLAFIGETSRVGDAKKAVSLAGERSRSFTLSAEGCGRFGSLIYACAAGSGLFELANAVRSELAASRLPMDGKPFNPHITLAREADCPLPAFRPASMAAESISLMRSERIGGRLVYTEIENKRLL